MIQTSKCMVSSGDNHRKETAMKRVKAYLLFFSAIVILSSIGVAAEKAVRSLVREDAKASVYVHADRHYGPETEGRIR